MEFFKDEELKELNGALLKMGTEAGKAIYEAIGALEDNNTKKAHCVVDNDEEIDEMELENENLAIDLLERKKPAGAELRFITTALKVNAEIERIADLAVNIAQRVLDLESQNEIDAPGEIKQLSRLTCRMMKASIEAFIIQDEKAAKKVILLEPEADQLRNRIYKKLVHDRMAADGKSVPVNVPLLLISRHLERVSDHATYIAEDVIYLVEAKVVKHHLEKLKNNGPEDLDGALDDGQERDE